MAKEEDLKRVDLKVSVNCCEGCRKKVLKALSIKGVLRTEIHPTLPKVTVVGNVDTNTLIKKLARVGKSAQVLVTDAPKPQDADQEKLPPPPESGDKKTDKAGKKDKDKEGNCTGASNKPTSEPEKKDKKDSAGDKKDSAGNGGGGDKKDSAGNGAGADKKPPADGAAEEKAKSHAPEGPDGGTYTAVITGVPQMNYVAVNPSMAAASVVASQARVYYPMEPIAVPVAMPYGRPMNAGYPPAPPPYYVQDGYYYELQPAPAYRAPPPQSQQPTGFGDYFNEDNTVGCHVM